MSANPPSADLVRLTVSARNRTTDLVLPSRLPLAEILPEVASMAGSLDAYEAYGGYALVQVDGRALDPDSSFLAQGVRDGAVLSLVTGAEAGEKKVYDDVTEAVADSVENVGAGWTEQAARLTTLGVSALLLVLGVLALFIQRGHGPVVVIVASVATVLLVLAGAVFARVRSDLAAGTVVLLAAALFAVVGVLSSVQGDPFQLPLLGAGIALVVVGGVSMGVARGRGWAFMPVLVLGFAGAAIGGITVANAFEPARVVAILMVVAVILGSVIPWFALTSSRTMVRPLQSEGEILADPPPIDPERVLRGVGLAHELVLGLSLSVALLVAISAPVVVRLGWPGLALCWASGLVQVMRTRQYLLARDVLVGLVGGTVGITSATVAALLLRPEWGAVVGAVVGVLAVGVLVSLSLPRKRTVRWGRTLDLLEGLVLFSLIPLLVLGLGIIGAIRT